MRQDTANTCEGQWSWYGKKQLTEPFSLTFHEHIAKLDGLLSSYHFYHSGSSASSYLYLFIRVYIADRCPFHVSLIITQKT